MNKIDYELYQIKNGEEHRDYRFSSLRMLKHLQLQVNQQHYEKVYSGNVESNGSVGEVLESLYEKFNLQHPADYRNRSMSVSDIVVLHENGVDTAHFCDSVGFVEVPQFFLPAPTVNLETAGLSVDGHLGTWHTIGSFEIAGKDFFMLEHDEFGSTVANIVVDENGKLVAQDLWHGITPDIEHMIFEEQIKNPENYLAAAEGNSEENYNNIDGRIDTQSKLTPGDDTESHPEQLPEKKPSILAKLKDKQSELRKTSLESPETISPEKSKNKSELSLN